MTLSLLLAMLGGLLLGTLFFGGLWLTVRRIPASRAPALLLLGSAILRMAVLLGGLFLLMQGEWTRLLAALAGVLAARLALTRLLGSPRSPARDA